MSVTETPPETAPAASEMATSPTRSEPTGFAAVLGTGDHKVIGRLYISAALLFGIVVVGLGDAFAVEGIKPETLQVFSADTAYQLFTLARVGSIFLLGLPLVIGIAMVVVPLQIGSRSIAFPRAAAASFWGWLLGSGLLIASYAMNGGPGGGSSDGVNLWIAAMGLIVTSIILAGVCLATTVFALRTTGLSMARVPLYAWSVAVASILWILTLPVLLGHLVIMYVDHRSGGSNFIGSPAALYGSLTWLFRNPQIYVLAIPVLGFAADVLASTSGARMKLRPVAQGAIGAFGTVAFGAFLAVPSAAGLKSPLVIVMGLLAVVPVLAVAAAIADVFRTGSFKLNGGVVYAVAALLILLLATAAGALGSIPNVLDAPKGATVNANIFFVGVGNAVIMAAVIASLGGVHWWATKVGRKPANDKVGMLAAVVLLLGAAVATIPDLVSGITGKGQEIGGAELSAYAQGIGGLNAVAAAGIALVIVGVGLALVSFLPLLKRSDDTPADPWQGQTLEWLAPSPPPLANFDGDLEVVTSAEPLIDLREEK